LKLKAWALKKRGYGLKSFAWKGRIISSFIIPPEITILPSLHNHGQAPAEIFFQRTKD
jgi:hypothetical protein